MFHSFSHQVCYLKLPKKSEGSANVQWSRLDHSFLVYWDPKQRPETSWVCSVKNHKTSFSLGEIFWEKFVGQPLGVHDVQFSHLLVPCFIGEIWTQTNWRISDLNPSIFQVFHPHVRDMHLPIPTGATWGCWGVSNHERRPAWPPVTAPTEKNKHVGSCLRISAWLVVKRCFWKYHEKETTNSEFGEWTYFQKFLFLSFLTLEFFWFKKRVVSVKWHPGDFRRCEGRGGFCVLVGQPQKMFVDDLGDGLGKGGGIFQHFFWKCCSWNFEWEVVFFNWMRWTTIAVKTFREGFFLKQGCLNQFGVQRIKMQILILCNGKGL